MAEPFDVNAYVAEQAAAKAAANSGEPPMSGDFDPAAYVNEQQIKQYNALQAKYGTTPEMAKAAIESTARGLSFGASDALLRATGENPEDIRGREQANPITSIVGSFAGAGKFLKAVPIAGSIAKATAGALGPLGAAVTGGAIEGAALGAGNTISDAALGDVDINAQKIAGDLGMGALLGGGIGAVAHGIQAAPSMIRNAAEKAGEGYGAAMSEIGKGIEAPGASGAVVDIPLKPGEMPKNAEAMQAHLDNLKNYGGQEGLVEMPQADTFRDAFELVGKDMVTPPTQEHLDALTSQDAWQQYKADRLKPGKAGEIRRNWDSGIKHDTNRLTDKYINDIAPEYKATDNAAEAGSRVSESLEKTIKDTRESVGKEIAELKKTPIAEMNHLPGVIDYITEADPKIATMFDTTGDVIKIKPYEQGMALPKKAYANLKSTIEDLQKNPDDFERLFNLRNKLEEGVNVLEKTNGAAELTRAKSAMMDYIQDTIQEMAPELKVRDTMRRYAVNEANAKYLEGKIGADLGNWRAAGSAGPEESVLKKIFRDSKSVQAVRDMMKPEEFQKVLKDYMTILRSEATDQGAFSANKFYSKLNRGQYALDSAFADNPEALKKISAITDIARVFPDSKPINPSGTAQTSFKLMSDLLNMKFGDAAEGFWGMAKGKLVEAQEIEKLNAKLAGKSDQVIKLNEVQKLINKATDKIESLAKKIFSSPLKSGIIPSAVKAISDKEFNKRIDRIKELSENPSAMFDHLDKNVGGFADAAPNITQGLNNSVVAAVNFLSMKVPQKQNHLPLTTQSPFTPDQKQKFNTYFNAIDNPMGELENIRKGLLSGYAMEALSAVHPHLLAEMQKTVMGNFNQEKALKLPYPVKISLAKFLGSPLDENMLPANVMSYQSSLSGPQLGQQGLPKNSQVIQKANQEVIKRNSTRTQETEADEA